MSNIINLNKFRKKKNQENDESRAGENRAKHGRTKDQKTKDERDAKKASLHLDSHKLGDDET